MNLIKLILKFGLTLYRQQLGNLLPKIFECIFGNRNELHFLLANAPVHTTIFFNKKLDYWN